MERDQLSAVRDRLGQVGRLDYRPKVIPGEAETVQRQAEGSERQAER